MMKKILAILLVLTLVLGLSSVSFAASYPTDVSLDMTPQVYDTKSKTMSDAGINLTPGTTYYFSIFDNDAMGGVIKSTSAMKNYNLRHTANEGKKYISSVTWEVKRDGGVSKLFVAAKTVASHSSSDMDFDIDILLFGKNGAVCNGEQNGGINFSGTLTNSVTQASSYTSVDDNAPIVNFDDIDDTDPIELYFGNDVEFHVGAKGQKELYLKYTDDAVGTKNDIDEKYPNANLEYHIFEGTNKTFRRTGKLYIKASSINNGRAPYLYQISTAGALTQVNAKYDSSDERFVIDTATLNNYVVSDIALKTSGSTTTTPSTPSETPSETPSTPSGSTSSNASEIATQVAAKIKAARASGKTNPGVDLTVQDEASISASDLKSIVTAAKNAGGFVRIIADTTANGSLVGRMYVSPSSAAAVVRDLQYGIAVDGDAANATKAKFEKWYDNNVTIVHLSQNPTFGFPVNIAVRANLSDLNSKTLKFYSYDRSTGKYFTINSPAYWLDSAGYLHFTTTLAGDIIITDKALKSK